MGWKAKYNFSAFTGQRIVLLASSLMVTPCRKGSVLEDLMCRRMESLRMRISLNKRVMVGSCVVLRSVVYSDTRRKPKKAVVIAAQSITLSSKIREELNNLWFMALRRVGVMGSRLGSEWELPWYRLIPRRRRYNRSKSLKGMSYPATVAVCLIADRCSLTLEWELKEAMCVANRIRSC